MKEAEYTRSHIRVARERFLQESERCSAALQTLLEPGEHTHEEYTRVRVATRQLEETLRTLRYHITAQQTLEGAATVALVVSDLWDVFERDIREKKNE